MTYKVLLLHEAEIEIWEAAEHYEKEKEGLGIEFLDELEAAKQKLSENPQFYSFISSEKIFRRYSLSHFPYKIIFEIQGDQVIINAVRHDKREPFK